MKNKGVQARRDSKGLEGESRG